MKAKKIFALSMTAALSVSLLNTGTVMASASEETVTLKVWGDQSELDILEEYCNIVLIFRNGCRKL